MEYNGPYIELLDWQMEWMNRSLRRILVNRTVSTLSIVLRLPGGWWIRLRVQSLDILRRSHTYAHKDFICGRCESDNLLKRLHINSFYTVSMNYSIFWTCIFASGSAAPRTSEEAQIKLPWLSEPYRTLGMIPNCPVLACISICVHQYRQRSAIHNEPCDHCTQL